MPSAVWKGFLVVSVLCWSCLVSPFLRMGDCLVVVYGVVEEVAGRARASASAQAAWSAGELFVPA